MTDGEVGVCPAGGGHVPASVGYRLPNGDEFSACSKCGCLVLVKVEVSEEQMRRGEEER